MAEEKINPAVDPEQGENGQASNPSEPEKTVSIAEMQRRLKQAEEKHAKDTADAIEKALEKYKAESELTGKELEAYRQKEAEAEKQKMLDEIDQLKKEKVKRELTDEAIKTLSNRKLPVNDKVIGFVVKDTADDTLSAIADFESIISEIKAEFTQSEPPKTSSSFGGESKKSRADMFRSSRII
ncbi:capsid assembly scaffolding protein Gp46 family protein [Streptococcus jiangjianxini]|uniref:capsid assembly scaffolding protein Gp46 family protein n=1 Tax=Streptococcus jiangjianxini TaxID=3161189 RepID=UPI0032EBEDF1